MVTSICWYITGDVLVTNLCHYITTPPNNFLSHLNLSLSIGSLLNTWRGFSPESKYQKHLKLPPLYVSFVASNGKECASLKKEKESNKNFHFLNIYQNRITKRILAKYQTNANVMYFSLLESSL